MEVCRRRRLKLDKAVVLKVKSDQRYELAGLMVAMPEGLPIFCILFRQEINFLRLKNDGKLLENDFVFIRIYSLVGWTRMGIRP